MATNKFDEEICDWCGVNIDLWHGDHGPNCPHELLDFVNNHICHGTQNGYQVCTPCSKHMERVITKEEVNFSVSESWLSDKFHTDFCIGMRHHLAHHNETPEALPKRQKAPKPESET